MNVDDRRLPDHPHVSRELLRTLRDTYETFAETGLPADVEQFIADRFDLDVGADYAGFPLKNPWGKASGQLSMTARQVAEDVESGLGFVVLKTVIAQDASGQQAMREWAIPESRMLAEPIVGTSGKRGWTVSWKGRGWWWTFDEYLQLIRDARQQAHGTQTLIVPSCKFHLPTPDEADWKTEEYNWTTRKLLEAWHGAAADSTPMPLEKDFSPTLAGSSRAAVEAKILQWLRTVPELVRNAAAAATPSPDDTMTQSGSAAAGSPRVRVGLKIFNALFDDDFQLEMLRTIHRPGRGRPDFYIYANRLFDPSRQFDGHRGIAYGGPDLSDRNLRIMSAFCAARERTAESPGLPWSATGDIHSGKMALEYALRGASSFQLHTFFQLPAGEYAMKSGSKTDKALHELYFHPDTGFVVWMHHLAKQFSLTTKPVRFREVVGRLPSHQDG